MTAGPGRRGALTVYLGAAPGVGKTVAMLEEAHRRRSRGTDVVVGLVETHGRAHTAARLAGLEQVPLRGVAHRGTTFDDLDVDAVLARAPQVVLVDELAHTVPGAQRRRVDDVAVLRAAGIEVVTTLNVQHLESLNDAVEQITGTRQRETVPDDVVRGAERIQLVDMAPDALRRRLAHGNVYPPDRVDASLASFFRVGNLTALRELALLWLADRVDDALDDYRRTHHIERPWPARERIVVAVTGGAESETLLRRGAPLAQRAAGSELLAVQVLAADGLRRVDDDRRARAQALVADLGGSFHTVIGDDVARAVVEFATGANATMVVVGVSRHGGLRRLLVGTTGDRVARLAGAVDVHLVTHDQAGRATPVLAPGAGSPLGRARRAWGWVLALLLPAALTAVVSPATGPDELALAELLLLTGTVVVALVGGRLPALAGAVWAFVLLNWFFTEPIGTLSVRDRNDVLALAAFLLVAAAVADVVHRASRRSAQAAAARAEAATMGALSQSVLTGADTAEAVVARVREAFGRDAVALVRRTPAGRVVLAADGAADGAAEGAADATAEGAGEEVVVDDAHVLVLHGPPLAAPDHRLLEAFAVQTSLVLEYRRLREQEQRATLLESAEQTSTAVLRAVSHDLRTPLATLRTSLDGLATPGLDGADRDALLGSAQEAGARLERLIDDLLDLSRLGSGLLRPHLGDHSLEEVLPLALAGHAPGAVRLEVAEDAPLVRTDPGLLARVVANVVDNAVRVSAGRPVRVLAHAAPDRVDLLVVDRGPGLPAADRARMFEPFQRLGDAPAAGGATGPGVGLGLAVAHGLAGSLGASLEAEDTPGGGLTMVVGLPRAGSPAP